MRQKVLFFLLLGGLDLPWSAVFQRWAAVMNTEEVVWWLVQLDDCKRVSVARAVSPRVDLASQAAVVQRRACLSGWMHSAC